MTFDLTGAAASHGFTRDPIWYMAPSLVLLAFVAASWALRPEGRMLGHIYRPRGQHSDRLKVIHTLTREINYRTFLTCGPAE